MLTIYVFPLYLFWGRSSKQDSLYSGDEEAFRVNRSEDFLDAFGEALGVESSALEPESVFAYLYAILHSPIYRQRYAEFLRRDFPRIPLLPSRGVYDQLTALGKGANRAPFIRVACNQDAECALSCDG